MYLKSKNIDDVVLDDKVLKSSQHLIIAWKRTSATSGTIPLKLMSYRVYTPAWTFQGLHAVKIKARFLFLYVLFFYYFCVANTLPLKNGLDEVSNRFQGLYYVQHPLQFLRTLKTFNPYF